MICEGEMTLPRDLLILRPSESRVKPCVMSVLYGAHALPEE